MDWDLQKEAPNVVTEPMFRQLLAKGYEAEVVCREEAYIKASVWYGQWVVRVVDRDRTFEKMLVTTPRRVGEMEEIRIRVFKTLNGLTSFIHKMGFAHVDAPLLQGGRRSLSLPNGDVETDISG